MLNAVVQFLAIWYFCQKFSHLDFKTKFSAFLKMVFPTNRAESLVLLTALCAYTSFAAYIALNYRIVFDDRIPWDAYFSFDNRSIVMTGGGFERHPLSNYFFDAVRELAFWFSGGKKDGVFRLVLAVCSAVTVSFSMLQIFKYLRNIIRLPVWISTLLAAFFGLFSTSILLSFTPETYTYTLFLLCLFNYYAALKFRKDEKIPASALTLATISVGGLTITNAAKVFIPVLFEKKLFRSWKNFLSAVYRVAISVIVFILLYLNRLNFDWHRIFTKTGEQYEKFSKPKVTPLWDMVSSWFFGGNILFSSFVIRDYHNKKDFQYKALFMDVYSSWMPYVFVALVLGLMIWSVIKNRKNMLVWMLFLSFLFDVIIHCGLKFGLHTSYIYGGHFVFAYPFLFGWLLYAYRNKPKYLAFLIGLISVMLLFLAANNLYRLTEFFDFLNAYYQ